MSPSARSLASGTLVSLAIVVAAAVLWIGVPILSETFGAGAPYYGRTTNMDKWSDSLFRLGTVGAAALVLISSLLLVARRIRANH